MFLLFVPGLWVQATSRHAHRLFHFIFLFHVDKKTYKQQSRYKQQKHHCNHVGKHIVLNVFLFIAPGLWATHVHGLLYSVCLSHCVGKHISKGFGTTSKTTISIILAKKGLNPVFAHRAGLRTIFLFQENQLLMFVTICIMIYA